MKQDRDERDLLDILFASRNRAYGAYQLRRNYPEAMRKALFFGLSGPVLLLFLGSWLSRRDLDEAKKQVDVVIACGENVKFEKEIPPIVEPLKRIEAPKAATVRFIPPTPTPDHEVEKEAKIADLEDLEKGQVSTKTQAGTLTDLPIDQPIDLDEFEKGPTEAVKKAQPDEPLVFVERMPEFPGGDAALFTFFAKNVVYPAIARETGIEHRINVQFIVETDGSISDVQAIRPPSKVLADEAVRVARMMPRWQPGEQNGRNVRVRRVIPIHFRLE